MLLWDASQVNVVSINVAFRFWRLSSPYLICTQRTGSSAASIKSATVRWWRVGPHNFFGPLVGNEYTHVSNGHAFIVRKHTKP